jgi:hypothetical protein
MRKNRTTVSIVASCVFAGACSAAPVAPDALPDGRWTGGGACLSVQSRTCDFVAGCGHGQFAAPAVRADGTFSVEGTYRIEVGPISIEPAPPATFSGVLSGGALTITVAPRGASPPPATYMLRPASATVRCTVPCV